MLIFQMLASFHNNCGILGRFIGVFLFLLCFSPPSYGTEVSENQTQPAPQIKEEQEKNLVSFITYATDLSRRIIDLKKRINDMVNPADFQKQLAAVSQRIDNLTWQISMAKTDPYLTFEQISMFKKKLRKEQVGLNKISSPLSISLEQLARWRDEWSANQKELSNWQIRMQEDRSLKLAEDILQDLRQTVDTALKAITEKLQPTLATVKQVSALRMKIYSLTSETDQLIKDLHENEIQQTAPSFFSPEFFSQIDRYLWVASGKSARNFFLQQSKYIGENRWNIVGTVLVIFLLALLISRSGRYLEASIKWRPFTKRPFATAVFICLIISKLIYGWLLDLPLDWGTVVEVIIILAVIRLTGLIVDTTWKKRFLRSLFLFLITTLFVQIIRLPLVLIQIYVAFGSGLGALFFWWQGWILKRKREAWYYVWGLWIGGALLLLDFIAITGGYNEFAVTLFVSLLKTIIVVLIYWIFFLLLSGALELVFLKSPFPVVSRNGAALVKQVTPALAFLLGIHLLLFCLEVWHVYPTKTAAWQAIVSKSVYIGSLQFNFRFVFLTAAIIYGVLLISRAVRSILLQEVLPRYSAALGVQLSIARLVNYAIFVTGFIILLQVLGFELTKLTILGGALGVGIGFGLQAIVNNFISGLILLFERPIKIGDTIQLGAEYGEVKKLGLRATIIQTFDNSEIVVPNSDMITGQVTNWTLAERMVRVKVPVGVAYGSDIAKVLEILMSCAMDHPQVLSKPKPSALFLAFGASSLDFELRVWTPEFTDRRQVLSGLNQDIEYEFQMAGIKIPFPQTDLHLRSVDPDAAASLKSTSDFRPEKEESTREKGDEDQE